MPDLSPRGGGEAEARDLLTCDGLDLLGWVYDHPDLHMSMSLAALRDALRSAVRAAYREEVMAGCLVLPAWVGERHWVCLCPRPNNLLDKSHPFCMACQAARPAGDGA